MNNNNYKIPVDPGRLTGENGAMQMCSVAESIAQHLMLLITTKKKENRHDLNYGNAVWDIEFDNAITAVEWETIFVESMKKQIAIYEPRIISPKISLHIEFIEYSYDTKRFSEMKKKAKIAINARLVETDELFSFTTELYLSPMSVD
jgi:phage baseplate assembly protein W